MEWVSVRIRADSPVAVSLGRGRKSVLIQILPFGQDSHRRPGAEWACSQHAPGEEKRSDRGHFLGENPSRWRVKLSPVDAIAPFAPGFHPA